MLTIRRLSGRGPVNEPARRTEESAAIQNAYVNERDYSLLPVLPLSFDQLSGDLVRVLEVGPEHFRQDMDRTVQGRNVIGGGFDVVHGQLGLDRACQTSKKIIG